MRTGPLNVLLVDDDEDDYVMTRDLLAEIEGANFQLEWVATYDAAVKEIQCPRHDVYLLDYRLGEHDGLELLREAITNGCQAPMILLTGQGDRVIDVEAMKAGAADYLIKGRIDAPLLERAIRYAFERKQAEREIRLRNVELSLKNTELAVLYVRVKSSLLGAVQMFSAMLETYDEALGGHSTRVASLARDLAARLGLEHEQIEEVEIAARLHDVGLVCLPEHLAKSSELEIGKLNEQSKALFRRHPEFGQQIVSSNEHFVEIGKIIRAHHERYDGVGYPDHLKGESIPIGARIIAIASQYDRIGVKAGEKNSWGDLRERRRQEAIQSLRAQRGGGLDPHLTLGFLEMLGEHEQDRAPLEVKLSELRAGMVLAAGISSGSGMLIIRTGTTLQPFHLARLESFNRIDPITQKLFVQAEGKALLAQP